MQVFMAVRSSTSINSSRLCSVLIFIQVIRPGSLSAGFG